MKNHPTPLWRKFSAVALAVVCATSIATAADLKFKADPAKVLGAENCKECHAPIFAAWEQTHHFGSYSAGYKGKPAMHRTDAAKAILKKMGMRSAKRGLCVECHYTGQASSSGRIKTLSGTSCESCHGAGKDWNKIHSNKEDPQALAKAGDLGMIRPHQTYAVAANCYTCHTVPNEDLVNKGGHTAGSDFELVSWSQGEIRHNLQKTEGKTNTEARPEHKRVMYVTGRLLDLEYSIRALAKATADGTYSQKLTDRINKMTAELKKIGGAGVSAAGDIAGLVAAGQLKAGNEGGLTKLADAIASKSKAFADGNDGSQLAGVDGMIPTTVKGKVYQP